MMYMANMANLVSHVIYAPVQLENLCMMKMKFIRSQCTESCLNATDPASVLRIACSMMNKLVKQYEVFGDSLPSAGMLLIHTSPLKFILDTAVTSPANIVLRYKKFRAGIYGRIKTYVTITGDTKYETWCRSQIRKINLYSF